MASSFPRFQDVPPEIQDEIWHYFAGHRRNKEKVVLLHVSKHSSSWAKDRLYNTIYIHSFNAGRIASAVRRNPAPFQEKTRELELSIYSLDAWVQAREILPLFRSLRRARLGLEVIISEAAEILLRNPKLEELAFELGVQPWQFSPSALAIYLTHLILVEWPARPLDPRVVLPHFPQLTHMAVRCSGEKTEDWLRAWRNASPSTLYVFLILDRQSHNGSQGSFHIRKPLLPRPVVSKAFHAYYSWDTYPSMWIAVEAAIQRAEIEENESKYLRIT
ncbi:hypothetical protein DL96DRAFT_1688449 [Flagelloscypha sp. PMI_526]|nr:hypothetical protein DL96DRAFT_1688449 [Flagelloscypha sp. PMI_526]